MQAKKNNQMKKNTNILILLILILTSTFKSFSQEITEENYLKLDKEIWEFQDQEFIKISKIFELNPEKKDSLIIASDEIVKVSDNKNLKLAINFASVPSGLQRVFMLRLNIPKDTLQSILKSLPKDMQESNYGKSIRLHIDSKQMKEGEKMYDFKAIDSNGKPFQISYLKGKNILLLYGGIKCIGEEGITFLKNYYDSANSDKFQIVIFDDISPSVKELKTKKEKFNLDFILVSDFKKDHSPMKIIYGAQRTPTCFLINGNGEITLRTDGLPEKELEKLKSKIN